MKVSDYTNRQLIFRRLDNLNIPSSELRELTDNYYRIDLPNRKDTIIFKRDINPFALQRRLQKEYVKWTGYNV